MNYQHSYHAGCAADVFKHVVLLALLEALQKKDTPFCYIDTHAGSSLYDLTADASQKTGEYLDGISKILNQPFHSPLINQYIAVVKNCNLRHIKTSNNSNDHARKNIDDISGNKNTRSIDTSVDKNNTPTALQFYPGSPFIARSCLRPQDQMIVMDFHEETYQQLKHVFARDKQVHTHHYDGYLALKAFLPPKERRGLVLIDPPYEDAQEFTRLRDHLAQALQRWSNGIYAIWYPIKNRTQITAWHKQLSKMKLPNILVTELCPWPDDVASRLNGSGMIIVNPPWQLDSLLTATLPELLHYLQCHEGSTTNTWWLQNEV